MANEQVTNDQQDNQVLDVLMTFAHHHLGDLILAVKAGKTVRLWNGTRRRLEAVVLPAEEYARLTHQDISKPPSD